ncbi:hypothetical protein VCUG_00271 [Vavraia culicis subsp. floridensis]|uniref:Nrap protein domain-containing protein n=1 Tax=Vavraia culicis (isolate floridensis) TaxID=948595 RepID=L2GYQ0_VAVCU|nr:uncharacterized protein VCUG_00271 [Vavraia culicis subsp. floridensis]ELA48230.1 hypothetical protein VCUG_00271 [Vavraia culicis subsp. floridensis]
MDARIKERAHHICKKLSNKNIEMNVNDVVRDLEMMKYKKMERLAEEKIYKNYLDYKTRESKIFERIKNEEDVIYDMKLYLNTDIDCLSFQEHEVESYFIHKKILYIKFSNDFFDDGFDIKKVKRIAKYCNAYRTDELYFNVDYRERSIFLLVQILKKVNLPLKILYYENCDSTVFLHMEDRKWPCDKEAIECVKSALLCHIYSHCKLAYAITRESVFLRLNDRVYKVMIKYERRADHDVEKEHKQDEVQNSAGSAKNLDDPTNEIVDSLRLYKSFGTGKKIAKEYIKLYLNAHGFLPFYIKNYEIDVLIAEINAVNPGQILILFIKLPKQKLASFKNLDSVLLNRLVLLNRKILHHLSQDIFINGQRMLKPSFKDYDFVLMKDRIEGTRENIVVVSDNDVSKFLLGQIEVNDYFGIEMYAYLLFSEYNQVLMVKMKDMKYISLVVNILLIKTSFGYLYKNF